MSDAPPANEHLETAEHIVHGSTKGGLQGAVIPLSIAVMAVIAAAFGSLETTAASNAVVARSDAAIRQGEATDLWGFYQAKSLKKNMYEIAATQPGADSARLKDKADKNGADEANLQERAKAKESEAARQVAISEAAMERHHRLAYASNIVHLAIAIASISIVIGRRWLWGGSLVCLGIGVLVGLT
jgi:hypothetical protein